MKSKEKERKTEASASYEKKKKMKIEPTSILSLCSFLSVLMKSSRASLDDFYYCRHHFCWRVSLSLTCSFDLIFAFFLLCLPVVLFLFLCCLLQRRVLLLSLSSLRRKSGDLWQEDSTRLSSMREFCMRRVHDDVWGEPQVREELFHFFKQR